MRPRPLSRWIHSALSGTRVQARRGEAEPRQAPQRARRKSYDFCLQNKSGSSRKRREHIDQNYRSASLSEPRHDVTDVMVEFWLFHFRGQCYILGFLFQYPTSFPQRIVLIKHFIKFRVVSRYYFLNIYIGARYLDNYAT